MSGLILQIWKISHLAAADNMSEEGRDPQNQPVAAQGPKCGHIDGKGGHGPSPGAETYYSYAS